MVVLAARVNSSPRPASKIEVDEGCSVRQVEHDHGALQPNEFEMTGCPPCVPSEVQRAVFVIACSWVAGTLLARLGLGYEERFPRSVHRFRIDGRVRTRSRVHLPNRKLNVSSISIA